MRIIIDIDIVIIGIDIVIIVITSLLVILQQLSFEFHLLRCFLLDSFLQYLFFPLQIINLRLQLIQIHGHFLIISRWVEDLLLHLVILLLKLNVLLINQPNTLLQLLYLQCHS